MLLLRVSSSPDTSRLPEEWLSSRSSEGGKLNLGSPSGGSSLLSMGLSSLISASSESSEMTSKLSGAAPSPCTSVSFFSVTWGSGLWTLTCSDTTSFSSISSAACSISPIASSGSSSLSGSSSSTLSSSLSSFTSLTFFFFPPLPRLANQWLKAFEEKSRSRARSTTRVAAVTPIPTRSDHQSMT